MRPRGALVVALAATAVCAAPAAAAPPSLTGEILSTHTSYTGPTSGVCTGSPSGNTSYSMDFAGTAAGPFPGTFTEHIEATVGPQTTLLPMGPFPDGFAPPGEGPDDYVPAGQLLSLAANFTINSPAATVTGTKTLTVVVPADSTNAGTCREWMDEDVGPQFGTVNGAYRDVRASGIAYEATITTAEGSFPDRGVTYLQARQGRVTNQSGLLSDVNDLGQNFHSNDGDLDGVPDSRDACPTTPAATANGCPPPPPPPDGDGDGVPNSSDACPTVPAATANGCPADTTRPIFPKKASTKLTGRTLALRIGPFNEAVTGTVSVRSGPLKARRGAKPQRIKLAARSFQAPAGKAATVKFKLRRKLARLVKRLNRVKLKATITARDSAGNTTTKRVTVTLKP